MQSVLGIFACIQEVKHFCITTEGRYFTEVEISNSKMVSLRTRSFNMHYGAKVKRCLNALICNRCLGMRCQFRAVTHTCAK